MTYTPTQSEKSAAAVVQICAGAVFFISPVIALLTKVGKISPYVHYWAKICLIWSIIMAVLVAVGVAADFTFDLGGAPIILWILHFVVCMTGAICSYFNTPFGYWFIATRYCREEMGNVYGQLISTPQSPQDES